MSKIYTIEEIRDIVAPIAREYDLKKVYLFGSYARGEADEKSDVDIRLEGARCLGDELALCSVIPDALGKEVDIVFTEDLRKKLDEPYIRFFVKHMKKSEVLLYERISDQ